MTTTLPHRNGSLSPYSCDDPTCGLLPDCAGNARFAKGERQASTDGKKALSRYPTWCCPHGLRFGDGGSYMPMDQTADGCQYRVDAETELLRARASVISQADELIGRAKRNYDTAQMRELIRIVGEAATTMTLAELREQYAILTTRIGEACAPY